MKLAPRLQLIVGVVLLLVLAIGAVVSLIRIPPRHEPGTTSTPRAEIDHYLLALTWSPSYCLEADGADRVQCAAGQSHGFILRGLWAQSAAGPLPCVDERTRVSQAVVMEMADIVPSARLVGIQWRRHGACTGLSQEDYFDLMRRAYERVIVPNEFTELTEERRISPRAVERAFIAANPGLSANMVGVTCTERHLQDVRVCLSKSLAFRACRSGSYDCRSGAVVMPPNVRK